MLVTEVVFKILNRAVARGDELKSDLQNVADYLIKHAKITVGKDGVSLEIRDEF